LRRGSSFIGEGPGGRCIHQGGGWYQGAIHKLNGDGPTRAQKQDEVCNPRAINVCNKKPL
jgi:hypothetical protein